jgi:nucleoside-diphosphate-sugar epimerase
MRLFEPVLVTGAGGFVGARLVHMLNAMGVRATPWTRKNGDLRDAQTVRKTLEVVRPAIMEGDWSTAVDEVSMINNLADSMEAHARLIHCGSMSEYGYSGLLSETSPRRARSVYGFGKAISCDRALAYALDSGKDIRVARLFSVYGPGEAKRRLVPHLVEHLSQGIPVPLGDGGQMRDFVHVDDVCDRLIAISQQENPTYRVFNIGTGVAVSVKHVAECVADMLSASRKLLEFGEMPPRSIDEQAMFADTRRLALLGAVPNQYWTESAENPATAYVSWLCEAAARNDPLAG